MSNIDEDIKYVKEMLEIARVFFKTVKAETDYKDVDEIAFCNAIKNILAEREQDKARIKELEEELRKYKSLDYIFKIQNEENYVDMKKIYFEWLDSIPKQVVIDKVNEINKKYEDSKDENGESPYFYPDFTIRILQKLLEGEK